MFYFKHIAGIVISFVVFSCLMIVSGSLEIYWDIISATTLIMTLISYTLVVSPTVSIKSLILKKKLGEKECQAACTFLSGLAVITLVVGVIELALGVVVAVANLSDPEAIGPGLAVATICPLYSTIVYFFISCYRDFYRMQLLEF